MASLCDERFLPLVNSRLSKDRTDYAAQLLRWSASLDVRKEGTQQVYTFDDYCKREVNQMSKITSCKKCGKEIDTLAVFPGYLCLDCYRPIGEAEAKTMTAEKLAAMWGGANGA